MITNQKILFFKIGVSEISTYLGFFDKLDNQMFRKVISLGDIWSNLKA